MQRHSLVQGSANWLGAFGSWQHGITAAWHITLLLLAFALPFELITPWFAFADILVFTNLELIALVCVGLWIAHQILVERSPAWMLHVPLARPIGLLFLVLLLAAVLAPLDRMHALKVVARWGLGILVYFMIVDAQRSNLPASALLRASVLGGIVVAALAWLEVGGEPAGLQLLSNFREIPVFRVGGEVRASSTLGYVTIAAQYLELIFVFCVGWLALRSTRRVGWRTLTSSALPVGALVLVGQALLLTLTRSALLAVGLALPMIVSLRWLVQSPRFRLDAFARAAILGELILGTLVVWSIVSQPLSQLRFTSESDRSWYRADIQMSGLTAERSSIRAGEIVTPTLTLRNRGERTWEARGDSPVYVFYHWLSTDGKLMHIADGQHTPLPQDVAPGESITLAAPVIAPAQPGEYLLAWDMLREGLFWFSVLGNPTHDVPVTVEPAIHPLAQNSEPNPVPGLNVASDLNIDRLTLWRAALDMVAAHPLLGVGPGNFRLAVGAVLGRPVWDTRLHANNTYLEMFADAGLLGGAAFLLFAVALGRQAWRALASGNHEPIVAATVVTALAAFLIHGVTDYFLEFTSIYLFFWMLVGMLAGLSLRTANGRPVAGNPE